MEHQFIIGVYLVFTWCLFC